MDTETIDRVILSNKLGRVINYFAQHNSIGLQNAIEMVLSSKVYEMIEKPQTAYWLKGDVELIKLLQKELIRP